MHRRKPTAEQGLSPWRAKPADNDDETDMSAFYCQTLPKLADRGLTIVDRVDEEWSKYRHEAPVARIRSRRPVSNVQSIENSLPKNMQNRAVQSRHRETQRSAQRLSRDDVRKVTRPLQQIQTLNFVLQGTIPTKRQVPCAKKECSYVMKQKFVEIRRSMNLQLGIWGSIRPQDACMDDKQNLLFRLTRYEAK